MTADRYTVGGVGGDRDDPELNDGDGSTTL